ncbi:PqqD family protein [Acidobacteriota bacterium]
MTESDSLNTVFIPSPEMIVQEIDGELMLVPVVSGVGDMEDDLFILNDTGRDIWNGFNGKKTVKEIIAALESEYEAPQGAIEENVTEIVSELIKRKILIKAE